MAQSPTTTSEHPEVLDIVRPLCAALSLNVSHIDTVNRAGELAAAPELPYHRPEHCAWVAAMFAQLSAGIVSRRVLRHGILAAIYHDAAHPGRAHDAENTLVSAGYYLQHAPVDADIDRDEVVRIIHATSTESVPSPRDGVVRLLRDADLLQTVVGTSVERAMWRERLARETGSTVTEESSWYFVRPRLKTVQARQLLDRYKPEGVSRYAV